MIIINIPVNQSRYYLESMQSSVTIHFPVEIIEVRGDVTTLSLSDLRFDLMKSQMQLIYWSVGITKPVFTTESLPFRKFSVSSELLQLWHQSIRRF